MIYREIHIGKVYTDNEIIEEEQFDITKDMIYREHGIGKVYTDRNKKKQDSLFVLVFFPA